MPYKPARPCRHPGCPALTTNKPGYCEDHQAQHKWERRNEGTTTERGYGHYWQKLRAAVLNTEPLCRRCGQRGKVTMADQVDHILPKASGGSDDWDNLQPLCEGCHKQKTNEDRKLGNGW